MAVHRLVATAWHNVLATIPPVLMVADGDTVITETLDAQFRRRPTAAWVKALSGRVPVGPVNDMRRAFENPFVAASGMIQSIDHPEKRGLRVFTLPVKIDGERPRAVAAEPLKR